MKLENLTDLDAVRDYLNRIGATPVSLRSAVIREKVGKYTTEKATIRFSEDGAVTIFQDRHSRYEDADLLPDDNEKSLIERAFKDVEFPKPKPLPRLIDKPKMMEEADKDNIFIFRNVENQIIFVQTRIEIDGEKHYVPWTYFDDGVWRKMYPDYKLPLYNAHLLKNASTIFLHEGAKAARNVQRMVDRKTPQDQELFNRHPWAVDLQDAVHIGWIGGAPNAHRTDWEVLKNAGVSRVYIVADNDIEGKQAIPEIAYRLNIPCFSIEFTNEWPDGFDLGDEWPNTEKMFGVIDGETFYRGPNIRDVMHPATWVTEKVKVSGKVGRPMTKLRNVFKSQWSYIEEIDMFVNTEMPDIMRSEAILNKMLAPFSHVSETTRLMVKEYSGRSAKVAYQPGNPGKMVTYKGSSAINLHVPSTIKPRKGNIKPFLDFMEYLFPIESERYEMMKWCATLIARPEIRMAYGILLVSRMQGVGKTTLASYILAPLVGYNNVSYPTETQIVGQFNSWATYKRLAIVNEIYSGHSWKAYHSLKEIITERDLEVNQKYMRQYVVDNWVHVFASSNSERAMKMENNDRRWFYPKVTENIWPQSKFDALYLWLQSGGLSIIKQWAIEFNDYVSQSDRAPMTERKMELISASRSDAQQEAAALAEMLKDYPEPACLFMKEIISFIKAKVTRYHDSDLEIRKAMSECGVHIYEHRVKFNGHYQNCLMNDALKKLLDEKEIQIINGEEKGDFKKISNGLIREHLKKPEEISSEEM